MIRTLSMACAALVLSVLVLVPRCATAHSLGASYLSLNGDPDLRSLSGRWEIRLADLNDALDFDRDGNGEVSWGEIAEQSARTSAFVLSQLDVRHGEQMCAFTAGQQLLDQRSDGYYLVLTLAGTCAAASGPVGLTARLLFDRDASQRVLLKVATGATVYSTVLKPDAPAWRSPVGTDSTLRTFMAFICEGIHHIWIGYDHIAFLCLLLLPAVLTTRQRSTEWLPASHWRPVTLAVLRIVTAFTLAHSITLSLSALNIVVPPERPIEAGIAASVAIAGVVNLFPRLARHGTVLAFSFGLLHGFGFANVLRELDLSSTSLAWPLAGFNAGVEIGQLSIVLLVLPLIYAVRNSPLYLRRVVPAMSLAIAVMAGAWLLQRLS